VQFSKIIDEKNPSTPFLLLEIYKKIQNHTQTFHTFKMGKSNFFPPAADRHGTLQKSVIAHQPAGWCGNP